MRSLLLSLVLGAASLGLVAATPSKADATWWRSGSPYYSGYYYPGYTSYYYPQTVYYPSYGP